MKTTVVILSLIFISCGPNYYLRRAERNLKKAEQLGAKIKADTVFIERNIFIPEVKLDTLFKSKPGDTVYLTKDRLKIKYVNLPGDSVFIQGECKDSVIKVKEPIYINRTIKSDSGLPWWAWLIFGISAFFIVALIVKR